MTVQIPVRAISGGVAFAETIAAAKTMPLGEIAAVIAGDPDRGGTFVRRTGNQSSLITADPQEGLYWAPSGEDGSDGCFARQFSGPANVRWFGATGDGATDDIAALNASTALCRHVYVPGGTYRTTAPWSLPDQTRIEGETISSVIDAQHSGPAIRGNQSGVARNFWLQINRLQIRGNGSTSHGLDLNNWTYARTNDLFITNCATGIRHGDAGASAYYNYHTSTTITGCPIGVRNGALGNEIGFFGLRIGGCTIGTDDSLNSGVFYVGSAVEAFTLAAHRVGNGGATVNIRFLSPRVEGGPLGFDFKSGAQDCLVWGPGITAVTTEIADGGIRTVYQSSIGTLLHMPASASGLPSGWLWDNTGTVVRA